MHLLKRGVLPAVFLCALITAAASAAAMAPRAVVEDPRLNIVLITADDLGKHLGAYGDQQARTPTLDALAASGVLFQRAYVTQASCSSSRASMLTGLYPHQHGQTGLAMDRPEYRLKPGVTTLPALLRQAGYLTAIIGKLHIEPEEAFPFELRWQDPESAIAARDVRRVAAAAGRFIRQRGTRPFFLYVNFFDPHRPYDAASNQFLGLPEQPLLPGDAVPFPFLGLDGPAVRREIASYYNSVSRLDSGIGLLLAELARAQVLDNTLVVFVSDHGPPFARAKLTSYEAGEGVPMLIRWPGQGVAGLRSDALVSTVDLMPTLLDAAGIPLPRTEGSSLRPLLAGTTPATWRGLLYTEFTSHAQYHFYPRRAVRSKRYKLIHNLDSERPNPVPFIGESRVREELPPEDSMRRAYSTLRHPPEWELYDLQQDPHETRNLAPNPRHAQRLANLQASLLNWRTRTADPLLNPAELERQRQNSNNNQQEPLP